MPERGWLRGPSQQELTVQIYITMAARWMMPRLHRLQKQCPDLMVRFNASQMDWEFDPLGADVGIICTPHANTARAGIYFPVRGKSDCRVQPETVCWLGGIASAADLIQQTLLEVYTTEQ